ncbi:hypothetical protein PanWU01x14_344730, partial [Parasponia andersonii]
NTCLVLKKDLIVEGKVDEVEDDMGSKNLWANKVLADDHVDSPVVDQIIRLDSHSNFSSKTEDLDPKQVFVKKDGDDNSINVAIDPTSKKNRNGTTSRRARLLTLVLPPRVAQ